MHVKSRLSGAFNAQRVPTVKNWVIGWTLAEACAAAEHKRGDAPASAKSGSSGIRATGRR